MTQQNIYYGESSKLIRESFISHIKNSIIKNNQSKSFLNLEDLHEIFEEHQELLQKGTDQSTIFHKAIYSSFDDPNYCFTEFCVNYRKLSLEVLVILKDQTGYKGEWAIQRFPTIRIQFPNNLSVFEFHRDSNYSHPIAEINCFYAINNCYQSSALQVERNLGFEDYVPLNLNPGQYALLNTSIYKHGDILNKTKKTRISMDFRFIPISKLTEGRSSLTKAKEFNTNSYFIRESMIK